MRTEMRRLGVAASLLALAACGQPAQQQPLVANGATAAAVPALAPFPAALPLTATGLAGPVQPAPPVARLPRARPLAWGAPPSRTAGYAWIDRADTLTDAVADAPPDYRFGYDGAEPWGWQTDDGYQVYAEPVDAGYRYYYYQPGDAYPFLVRDPRYSYGYASGRVVAVYDAGGRYLDPWRARAEADAAARYYARAQALYVASRQVDARRGVIAADWAGRRGWIDRDRARWGEERQRDTDWRAYRHGAHERDQQHWAQEAARRHEAAQQFAGWQQRGYPGQVRAFNPQAARFVPALQQAIAPDRLRVQPARFEGQPLVGARPQALADPRSRSPEPGFVRPGRPELPSGQGRQDHSVFVPPQPVPPHGRQDHPAFASPQPVPPHGRPESVGRRIEPAIVRPHDRRDHPGAEPSGPAPASVAPRGEPLPIVSRGAHEGPPAFVRAEQHGHGEPPGAPNRFDRPQVAAPLHVDRGPGRGHDAPAFAPPRASEAPSFSARPMRDDRRGPEGAVHFAPPSAPRPAPPPQASHPGGGEHGGGDRHNDGNHHQH